MNEAEIFRAKIIGLWGDPGITEANNYDILSRFLIVLIPPFDRCVTQADRGRICLVLRPKDLWITSAGSLTRIDSLGNINKQLSNTPGSINCPPLCTDVVFTSESISPISPAYRLGDEISIVRLGNPLGVNKNTNSVYNNVDVFSSQAFANEPFMSQKYASLELTKFTSLGVRFPSFLNADGQMIYPHKYYFPAWQEILRILGGYAIPSEIHMAEERYVIANDNLLESDLILDYALYEDLNSVNRKRTNESSSCVPLVVVNPSTFPTPATRNTGGINIGLAGPPGPPGPAGPAGPAGPPGSSS